MLARSFLAKPVDEERFLSLPEKNNAPESTRLALPLPRQALFDDPSAKIGVNQSLIRSLDCFAKRVVFEVFTDSKIG